MAIDPSSSTPFSKSDDLALVQGVLDRRQEALAELYDRYAPLLLAVSRRVLAAPAEAAGAESVLQETFFEVWNQAERFDSGASSVSAWLVLIARDRALARLRRRPPAERGPAAHSARTALLSERGVETLPGVHVESRAVQERRQRVQAVLATLSAEQKQALEMAFFEGLSLSEIADRTRTPFEVVKARALLAMKTLRRDLRAEIRELM
ncbi:MAG: sigma-70 family RNA polymerase sigma factor [Thermoanaerobaculia bacterium]|jgi:RNA polymerase sigma-70 factor (ECF subfamily)|nr:sigma-70 family RNA polymerase sigma factor [Thermoanaerobaculia bacterium]MBP9825431.1 sigma-70 family RNA polymerase sigma factor [Thermoanaerobaculia bacterium]